MTHIETLTSFTQKLNFTEVNGVYSKEINGEQFTFKSIADYNDFQSTIPVQQESFSIEKDLDVCPADMLATLKELGGSVTASYDSQQQLASFIYLWPKNIQGVYWLDMIGVLKKYQDHGVGQEIFKVLVLESIKRGNISQIDLTYDPLKVRNANLYIKKMGGRVCNFKHNPYGEALDGDRFVVSYDISDPVSTVNRIANPKNISPEEVDLYNLPHIRNGNYPDASQVVLTAPRENDLPPEIRQQFSNHYRIIGDRYINENGYTINKFITTKIDDIHRNYYLLENKNL